MVNKKAEKSRNDLKRKSNDLRDVLHKYRSTNKFCIDLILVILLIAIVGVLIEVLRSKGYF